jgi:hypothetical protein
VTAELAALTTASPATQKPRTTLRIHAPQQRSCRLDSTQQPRRPAHRLIWA